VEAQRPTRAVRLTFAYDGDTIQLLSRQNVEMITPPSEPLGEGEGHTGFWYELKNERDQTLYRRLMSNPVEQSHEVFSPERGRSIQRAPAQRRSGVFSVVVPEVAEARFVTLAHTPLPAPGAPRTAAAAAPLARRELTRVDLHQK
jgi:hypothetical protein